MRDADEVLENGGFLGYRDGRRNSAIAKNFNLNCFRYLDSICEDGGSARVAEAPPCRFPRSASPKHALNESATSRLGFGGRRGATGRRAFFFFD